MDKELIQQGDVLFFAQTEETQLPEGCKPRKADHRGAVFAEGEHTGHYHGTLDAGVSLFDAPDGSMWARVAGPKPATITHQEHGAVTLNPGTYRIGIVKEVDPFSKEIHDVRD